jgi:choline-sulfatase
MKRLLAGLLPMLFLVVFLGGCGDSTDEGRPSAEAVPPEPTPPPDVLLIVVDTLRADHVGCYGHDRDTTPTLDQLAAGGTLFEVAYAPLGSTTPSLSTLFTGRSPISHGVVSNGKELPESLATLAETFQGAGYRTIGVASSHMAGSRWGLQQGFEIFDEEFPPDPEEPDARVIYRSPRVAVDRAIELLSSSPTDRPLFFWLHLFDPHSPYEPPAEHAALFPPRKKGRLAEVHANYEAEVHFSDEEIGRFLDALRRRSPEALIVAVADHGEGLMSHGYPLHSRYTFDEELRVPMIFHWPGRIAGGRRSLQPATLADVPLTLLGLADLPKLPETDGLDLGPWLEGSAPVQTERPLLLQRPMIAGGRKTFHEKGWGLGLRAGRWKSFEAPEEGNFQLYDLESDPREKRNLHDTESLQAKRMAALLRERLRPLLPKAPQGPETQLTPADLEALRSLGYLD